MPRSPFWDRTSCPSTPAKVSLPGGLSFIVNPGDSFFVQAQMTALSITNIAHQTNGTADALHTLAGASRLVHRRCGDRLLRVVK
jgi:hypothetical protein